MLLSSSTIKTEMAMEIPPSLFFLLIHPLYLFFFGLA